MARRRAALFDNLHGTITFIIREHGSWTVQLGNADAPVTPEADARADLVLAFSEEAFERFLAGTLDLGKAVAHKQVMHRGDPSMLVRFSRLLAEDRNVFATRMGASS